MMANEIGNQTLHNKNAIFLFSILLTRIKHQYPNDEKPNNGSSATY